MARRNTCSNRGATVGSSGRVPDDPSEFRAGRVVAPVGCNRLRCPICKSAVRSRAEVACEGDCSDRVAEIYETEDWLALSYVKKSLTGRLYACRCTLFLELRTTLVDDPDFDASAGDARLPWRCAGHPLAKLPVDIDGVVVGADEDFAGLVASAAHGGVPSAAHGSQRATPVQWLYRLRARLRGLPAADRFEDAMAASLGSGDEEQIAQALLYFSVVPESSAFPQALAALGGLEPRAYRDHQGMERAALTMLLDRAAQAGRKPDAIDLAVRDQAFDAALDPATPLQTRDLTLLTEIDPEWVANHATALARGRESVGGALLSGLYVVDRQELIVVAGTRMAQEGDERLRGEVRAWADSDWHSFRSYSEVLRHVLDADPEGAEA